ncbi:glycoside hydrolase family 5 protein [Auriculariales sp. MPI-PUGE-AT-0066]|nr:glycoside hydrolase family 5 protein [Auriculariales sp. MPI-PUGE-AT-0066]
MLSSLALLALSASALAAQTDQPLPEPKMYGVNLGNFLVAEPWMMPNEWLEMGGENCSGCVCIASEGQLALQIGQNATDAILQKHWSTWFTNADADRIAAAGLNTVRIPLGWWIVESLVDRTTEPPYARGGMDVLKSRLRYLKGKGLHTVLDLHAVPGVGHVNQQFAGLCTNVVNFYNDANYERAMIWGGVMTAMSHLDPDFESVYEIGAINEPINNAANTPNLGQYYTDYVQVVRAVEKAVGVFFPGATLPEGVDPRASVTDIILAIAEKQPDLGTNARNALTKIVPALEEHARKYHFKIEKCAKDRKPLFTNFQDIYRQWGPRPNPYDSADGPATYDNHLYFSFSMQGKNASAAAYMQYLCNFPRIAIDQSFNNTPVLFGEWSLATQWDYDASVVRWNSTETAPPTAEFLRQFADAQKYTMTTLGDGWFYWSFKIEEGSTQKRSWDYFEAVEQGFFPHQAGELFDPNVCDPYIGLE